MLVALKHYVALVIEAMAISPTWDEIGRLAAIRTFLNLFLERDMVDVRERIREGRVPASAKLRRSRWTMQSIEPRTRA